MCLGFFISKESLPGYARMRFSYADWCNFRGEGQRTFDKCHSVPRSMPEILSTARCSPVRFPLAGIPPYQRALSLGSTSLTVRPSGTVHALEQSPNRGTLNRFKLIMRQMYGRAKFVLS